MSESPSIQDVRAAYDAIATRYAEQFRNALADRPLDRAVITAFAELIRAGGSGPVADLGCGPGRMTAHLDSLGVSAFGVDLSPAMIALARTAHPSLRFDEGTMTALDLADGTLGGVLSWYSIIHMPPAEVPGILAEFHRVLAPGGHLLLGFFQTGDEPAQPVREFDHKVTLAYRWPIGRLAGLLGQAGFTEVARLTRQPAESERFLHGRLLARKPVAPGSVGGAVRISRSARQGS